MIREINSEPCVVSTVTVLTCHFNESYIVFTYYASIGKYSIYFLGHSTCAMYTINYVR